MNTLGHLQTALQAHLIEGDATIAQTLRSGGIGVERRLAIYRIGYRLRLLAAMKDTFGHTARWLGDERFDEWALAYIDAHPSTSSSLNDYAASWPDWLAQQLAEQPVVAELARLDWALRRAFDGANSPVLQAQDLASLPAADWADVGFSLVPTWGLLSMRWNTVALWAALDQDQQPPAPEPLPQARAVMVWRKGEQPHFRSLGADECAALQQLHAGASFAQLCDNLASANLEAEDSGGPDEGQAVALAGRWLQQWVSDELLAAFV